MFQYVRPIARHVLLVEVVENVNLGQPYLVAHLPAKVIVLAEASRALIIYTIE